MPIRLVDPRKGKSPNYSFRGTYLGVRVDKSSGTDRRSLARSFLKRLEGEIERGEYPPRKDSSGGGERTFLTAAIAYMEAGRSPLYVARLIKRFGAMRLSEIDQTAIDAAAIELYPNVTAGTRNVSVYTPVAAILHHAGVEIKVRRPKGAKGRVVTDWMKLDEATAIINAADQVRAEFGLLLRFLLYTGVRLGEALKLRWQDVELDHGRAWVRRQKSGPASDVRLRADLLAALTAHAPKEPEPHSRVFRFHQGGRLSHLLVRSKLGALGIACPAQRPVGWLAPAYGSIG